MQEVAVYKRRLYARGGSIYTRGGCIQEEAVRKRRLYARGGSIYTRGGCIQEEAVRKRRLYAREEAVLSQRVFTSKIQPSSNTVKNT